MITYSMVFQRDLFANSKKTSIKHTESLVKKNPEVSSMKSWLVGLLIILVASIAGRAIAHVDHQKTIERVNKTHLAVGSL